MVKRGMKKQVDFTLTAGIVLVVMLLVARIFTYPISAQETGWKEDEIGWWYQNSDGSYQRNGWFQDIDQNWYYFNQEGYMQTGWIRDQNVWYFADESGRMQTGVIQINGQVYYFNPVSGSDLGKMQTGKVMIQNKVYYLNANGTAIGEVPSAERSYQVPLQDAYIQESKSTVSSKVNDTNKDRIVLFESPILEEMIRSVLKEESNRSLTWNDLKGYSVASFQIMTDSRSKLVFQIELGTEEGVIGVILVGLEELEAAVKDLSSFPDLREIKIKGVYVKYSFDATSINQGYEENLADMEILLEVLAKHLLIDDMMLKMEFEMSIKEK